MKQCKIFGEQFRRGNAGVSCGQQAVAERRDRRLQPLARHAEEILVAADQGPARAR